MASHVPNAAKRCVQHSKERQTAGTATRQGGDLQDSGLCHLCQVKERLPFNTIKKKNRQTKTQLVKLRHHRNLEVILVTLTVGTPKSNLRFLSYIVPTLTQGDNSVNGKIKTPGVD